MERFRTVSFEPGGQTVVEIHQLSAPDQPDTKSLRIDATRRRRRRRQTRGQQRTWDAA